MFEILISFFQGFYDFFGTHGRGGTFLIYMVLMTMLIGVGGGLIYRLVQLSGLFPHENEFEWVIDVEPAQSADDTKDA